MDGIGFQGPAVPELEHNNTTSEDRSKKCNYSDTFDCRPFIRETILLPQRISKGIFMKDSHGNYVY